MVFKELLDERKLFIQQEVNKFVKSQQIVEAYGALARLEDIEKLYKVIDRRIETIQKGGNNG